MLDKYSMLASIRSQLAIDFNCSTEDFLRDGLIFTEAVPLEGRRPFPWRTPRLELVTMGSGVIINVSAEYMPYVRGQLEGKGCDDVFFSSLSSGTAQYFMPDVGKLPRLAPPDGFSCVLAEKDDIPELYKLEGFHYALSYDPNALRPDVLAAVALHDGTPVGVAGASTDCATMWQIGVDVLPQFREHGVAAALANMLALEILERGFIPYYGAASTNLASIRTALRAGFYPVWAHCWRTRLEVLQ